MSSAVLNPAHRPSVRAGVLAALLALLLPLLVVSGSSPARASSCNASSGAGTYGGGDGNPGTPHLICSPDHIAHLAATSGDWGKEFLQTATITLPAPSGTPAVNHTPIGTGSSSSFTGVYDGGGFEIRGVVLRSDSPNRQGFFGDVSGTLRNIHLVDMVIDTDASNYVGGLAAAARGGAVIEDSSVSGTIKSTASGASAGGLVGYATTDLFPDPNVPLTSITRSVSCATVEGAVDVGGLVGVLDHAVISASFASGNGTGTGSGAVGGLVGYADRSSDSITDSYAVGDVTGRAAVGGLIGSANLSNVTVERSYAAGSVTSVSGPVGGMIGDNPGTDPTSGTSFWDVTASGQSQSAGGAVAAGKTSAEMKDIATFAASSWAIVGGTSGGASDVWGIDPQTNGGYPFLLWTVTGSSRNACVPQLPVSETKPTATAAPSFVAPGGVLPSLSPGLGEWVQSDGSSVPLVVSSPGPNQVRYTAEGVQVTFTGGAGSDASRGLVANPNGEIVCEVCIALAAGQVIEVWMFSTPRLVAAHLTQNLPCQRFTIPVVAPLDGGGPISAGAHTLQLALPTAQGLQAVNVGVTVGGPVPTRVPAGEGPTVPVGLVAFGLLAAAGAAWAVRRQVVAG